MIGIHPIVYLQLPVAIERVIGAARHELHAVRPLFHRQIDKRPCIAKIVFKRSHIRLQANKEQPGVTLEFGDRNQIVIAIVEGIRISPFLAILDVEIPAR